MGRIRFMESYQNHFALICFKLGSLFYVFLSIKAYFSSA